MKKKIPCTLFSLALGITLSVSAHATDGSDPDTESTRAGAAPIIIDSTTTIKTAAYLNGELVETDSVKLKIRTPSPKSSKKSGEYKDSVKVKLNCADPEAAIYYTTDGSTPSRKSTLYKKPLVIKQDTVLKFAAYGDDTSKSKIVVRRYTITSDVYDEKQRQELFELINEARTENGLPPVEELPQLSAIAQQRAKECSAYFSHWRADGTKWDSLLAAADLKQTYRGENIAYYYPTAKGALSAWMDDYYHRMNVLDPNAKYIGIGYYHNGYTPYWVQIFIGDAPNS